MNDILPSPQNQPDDRSPQPQPQHYRQPGQPQQPRTYTQPHQYPPAYQQPQMPAQQSGANGIPPLGQPSQTPQYQQQAQPQQYVYPQDPTPPQKPRRSKKGLILGSIIGFLVLLIAAGAGAYLWYNEQLKPVAGSGSEKRITVEDGTSPAQIAQLLHENGLIRDTLAFDIYTRVSGTRSQLKAGSYNLSPSNSTQQIVDHLVTGKVDEFQITLLPGATEKENREALVKAGYQQADVDAAFDKQYDHPLFKDKPESEGLEGYVYGETYTFDSAATAEQVLEHTFDEYYRVVEENDLVNAFSKQGLNLYEGITLASIIQREVSGEEDSRKVAQVFFKRLAEDMPLGADATFVYAAKQAGEQPTVDFESPYNTRQTRGLPPGPISAPGIDALKAVANPAEGDFLYFVSGDDGKNYFSKTEEEHEKNTREHCKENCALF